eukprot:GSMAST32.ASY1.ANO1.1097.1 assembled CDS
MSKQADEEDQTEIVIFRYEREVHISSKIKNNKREVAIELIEEGWSVDHAKLVYLISCYGKPVQSQSETETWIREIPLTVLIYEGAKKQIFNFDYAPGSTVISQNGKTRRVWLNISQEGRAAPVVAYQVSKKGMDFLLQIPDKYKRQIDSVFRVPISKGSKETELLKISFDSTKISKSNKQKDRKNISADVSYVSSPYLPWCIRNPRNAKQFSSNAHRWKECKTGITNIADDLNIVIELSRVHCIVGEWIPFGANNICALNERLGALDRCQGGLFTSTVDKQPTDTSFSCNTGLTNVSILDFDFSRFINFEAEINIPEMEGIVQIENFGMHINLDGGIFYGMKIESILTCDEEHISLDHMSRLLVDIHIDSSTIMRDLLSDYQRMLLDVIYMGDSHNRGKFNMILAEGIDPFLRADLYLDRDAHENEIKQVLGVLFSSHDLGEHGVVILGRDGLLLAGHDFEEYEPTLLCYCSLFTREVFIRSLFSLCVVLGELLLYLKESLDQMRLPEDKGSQLEIILNITKLKVDVSSRIHDMKKIVDGLQSELLNIQQMTSVVDSSSLYKLYSTAEAHTKNLLNAENANEHSATLLEVTQVFLGGSFLFDIIDRISGGSLNIIPPSWVVTVFQDGICDVPFLWFGVNIALLLFFMILFWNYIRNTAEQNGVLLFKARIDKKIKLPTLMEFLHRKSVDISNVVLSNEVKIQKFSWLETDPRLWNGSDCPYIEIECNIEYGFIYTVTLKQNMKRNTLSEKALLDIFLLDLERNHVLEDNWEGVHGIMRQRRGIQMEKEQNANLKL